MEKINIYIHTNIKSIRSKAAGLFIWILEFMTAKGPITLTGRDEVTATWKEAELLALIKALGRVNKACELTIFTGNTQVAAALHNLWFKKWSSNGYENSKGEPIENADTWKEVSKALEKHTIIAATCQDNSYTSWMISELGEDMKEVESQYLEAQKTLEDIIRNIESLDASVIMDNPVLTKLVTDSSEMLFKKFDFLRSQKVSGFVKIGNEKNEQIKAQEEDEKTTPSKIMVH